MNKKLKFSLFAVIALILIGVAVMIGRTELFQAKLMLPIKTTKILKPLPLKGLFNYKNRVVSAVASPVTSVVVSKVTSAGGTSQVASAVTSAVASGVPVLQTVAAQVDTSKLPILSSDALKLEARSDFLNNRTKYTLTKEQRFKILDLYKLRIRK